MKKFSLLKVGLAAGLFLAFSGNANATINAGDYSFTSDMVLEDASYSNQLSQDCTVSISKNASGATVIIKGFLNSEFDQSIYTGASTSGTQEVELDQTVIFMGDLYFANTNGDYPVTYYDSEADAPVFCDYYLTWTFDENGNITIPDFTVVTLDETNHTTNIIARYSNCKLVDPSKVKPTLSQLAGTYTFNSTLSDVPSDYEDMFTTGKFDFTAEYRAGNDKMYFIDFIIAEEKPVESYDQETGIITLAPFDFDGHNWNMLYIADAEGNYPMSYFDNDLDDMTEPFRLQITIDGSGKLIIPDFTIVEITDQWDLECRIVAKYSNITAAKTDGFSDDDEVDLPGSYTVKGTKLDYTAGGAPVSSEDSFTLTIGGDGELLAIAGYDEDALEPIVAAGYLKGWFTLNSWNLSTYDAYLEKKGTNGASDNIMLSSGSTEEYQSGNEINLNYANETYSMSDFTIWKVTTETVPGSTTEDGQQTPDQTVTKATLLYAWKDLTVTPGAEDGDDDDDTVSAVGSHTFNWYKQDIQTGAYTQEEMTITINEDLQYTEIGGYTVSSDFIEYGYNKGVWGANTYTVELNNFGNVIELEMATGAGLFVSGPDATLEQPNVESELVLTYEDGEWTLSPFTIWQKGVTTSSGDTDEDGTTSSDTTLTWKCLYKWTPDQPTSVPTLGSDNENAPAVYYNLQGIRVDNPSDGIYIVRKGNKTSKVVINK